MGHGQDGARRRFLVSRRLARRSVGWLSSDVMEDHTQAPQPIPFNQVLQVGARGWPREGQGRRVQPESSAGTRQCVCRAGRAQSGQHHLGVRRTRRCELEAVPADKGPKGCAA